MKTREIKRLRDKFDEKTQAAELGQKLDEKKRAVEKLKTEIGERKNRARGLLNSIAM